KVQNLGRAEVAKNKFTHSSPNRVPNPVRALSKLPISNFQNNANSIFRLQALPGFQTLAGLNQSKTIYTNRTSNSVKCHPEPVEGSLQSYFPNRFDEQRNHNDGNDSHRSAKKNCRNQTHQTRCHATFKSAQFIRTTDKNTIHRRNSTFQMFRRFILQNTLTNHHRNRIKSTSKHQNEKRQIHIP